MNSNDRVQLILELLDGKATAKELAERHGVDEQELLAWRDTWLAGARAATRTRAPSRRWWVLGAVVGAAALGLISKEAIAATCAAPASFSNLGLNYFCPNDPALASEFNANTAQLVGLMQQKLGAGWGLPDAGASTSGITTTAATVTGASTLTGGATIGSASSLNFGAVTRQMVNLWGTNYGMGVQNSTLYFRSASDFSWFVGGTHSNTQNDPGAGGVEAMRLTSTGALSVRGLKQVNNTTPVAAPVELQRLIVEATPATVGTAVPINAAALSAMCADDDGCQFTISMVNWDGTANTASRSGMLFMSQSNGKWRMDNDVEGTDGDGVNVEWSAFRCYFGDFNFASDANNGRVDNAAGFGLLNCKGCAYSDVTTTCRLVVRD